MARRSSTGSQLSLRRPAEAGPHRVVLAAAEEHRARGSAPRAPPTAASPGTPSTAPTRPGNPSRCCSAGATSVAQHPPGPAAPQRAERCGDAAHGDGLGLGQVVALGVVGPDGVDDVEGREVGLALLGPVDPQPDEGAAVRSTPVVSSAVQARTSSGARPGLAGRRLLRRRLAPGPAVSVAATRGVRARRRGRHRGAAGPRGPSRVTQLVVELVGRARPGLGGGALAGEVAADVGRARRRVRPTGARRCARPRPPRRSARSGAGPTASRSGRSPATTTSVMPSVRQRAGGHGCWRRPAGARAATGRRARQQRLARARSAPRRR